MEFKTLIVGALAGAFFTALFSHLNEKWRVKQGYKEKVYERVVEAILTVHHAFSDYWHVVENFINSSELENGYVNFKRALDENRLYYPHSLYNEIKELAEQTLLTVDAAESPALAYFDIDITPYTDLATKKLNFMGLEILDMKIEKKKSKTPLQATP